MDNQKNKLLFEIERFNLKKQDIEAQISQVNRNTKEFEDLAKNPPTFYGIEKHKTLF